EAGTSARQRLRGRDVLPDVSHGARGPISSQGVSHALLRARRRQGALPEFAKETRCRPARDDPGREVHDRRGRMPRRLRHGAGVDGERRFPRERDAREVRRDFEAMFVSHKKTQRGRAATKGSRERERVDDFVPGDVHSLTLVATKSAQKNKKLTDSSTDRTRIN